MSVFATESLPKGLGEDFCPPPLIVSSTSIHPSVHPSIHSSIHPSSHHQRCLLCLHTGFPAEILRLEAVPVALATTVPELGTGVCFRVVVPPDLILTARPWIQVLAAANLCTDTNRFITTYYY